MGWIEQQATEAWAPEEDGARAEAAMDFLTVRIKPIPFLVLPYLETGETEPRAQWTQAGQPSSSANTGQNPGQVSGYGRRHERYRGGPHTSLNENDPRNRQRSERQVEKRKEDVVG